MNRTYITGALEFLTAALIIFGGIGGLSVIAAYCAALVR